MLRAVLLKPLDNNVRLIYADWLEDNGQVEQGRYIRASIAGEKDLMPIIPDMYDVLFYQNNKAWGRGPDDEYHYAVTIERGFIDSVSYNVDGQDKQMSFLKWMASRHPITKWASLGNTILSGVEIRLRFKPNVTESDAIYSYARCLAGIEYQIPILNTREYWCSIEDPPERIRKPLISYSRADELTVTSYFTPTMYQLDRMAYVYRRIE